MSTPRWLSTLLIVALMLSGVPASVSAAAVSTAPVEQVPAAAQSSYLLVLIPPAVSVPTSARAFDAAGYVNVEHARYYARVEAQLARLQQQGAIAGYAAQPAAYAFAIRGAGTPTLATLAMLGKLQPSGQLSAAAVGALNGAYQRQLHAAIAAGVHSQPASSPAALPPVPQAADTQSPGVAALGNIGPAGAPTPGFEIQLYSNRVQGTIDSGIWVTATLKTKDGVVKGKAYDYSGAGPAVYLDLEDSYGNPVFVAPTDILEMEVPNLIVIPVVNLQATIDPATEKATGFAPPDVTSMNPADPPALAFDLAPGGYITTTHSGTFVVDSPNVPPGRSWYLRYDNAQNQATLLRGSIPIVVLRGSYRNTYGQYYDDQFVSGAVLVANAVLTVTLTRAGSPPIVNFTRSDTDGEFGVRLYDLYHNPVDIQAGDSVQVTGGGVTLTVTAPTFAVTSNSVADTVSGTTNAPVVTDTLGLTQTLAVFPDNNDVYDYGKMVLAPGGSFAAANQFYPYADSTLSPATLDWQAGARGHLRYVDAAGNVVFAAFRGHGENPILSLRGTTSGYQGANQVYGEVDGVVNGARYGTITLLDGANAVKAMVYVPTMFGLSGLSGSFVAGFHDVYGNPLPILDNDSVVATFDGRTTTVKSPALTMSADPKADIVTGHITPGLVTNTNLRDPQSLALYAYRQTGGQPVNVLPDAAGNFTADFAGIADILPGQAGLAQYVDGNGNTVNAEWEASFDKPVLSLRGYGGYMGENYAHVDLFAAPESTCRDQTLLLVVKAPDNTVRWQNTLPACQPYVDISLQDDFGNNVNLNPGDVVEAAFAGQTTSALVPAFQVVSDAKTSTVSGLTNAAAAEAAFGLTQTLAVWPMDNSDSDFGKYVVVAGTAFSATNPFYSEANQANFPADLDWHPGQVGHLRYIDAAGNAIYAVFAALVDQPVLDIYKGANWVAGMAPVSSAPVTVTIMSGATVKGVGYAITDLRGEFDVQIYDGRGNPIEVAEGDQVIFSPIMTTVVVPPLTAEIDVENDRVTGKGPANVLLNVLLTGLIKPNKHQPRGQTVATDANGNFALDVRGLLDIQPGMDGELQYRNPDGHLIWIHRYAGARLAAALNTNRIWGVAPGTSSSGVVSVKRAGAVIGTAATEVDDEEGLFVAFPIDATGQPIMFQAGDTVEVDFGAGVVKTLTLTSLQMSIDVAANVLSGVGPATSLLDVDADTRPEDVDETVVTNASGQWTIDLKATGRAISAGISVSVHYSANAVDETWLLGIAPVFSLRAEIDGFEPDRAALEQNDDHDNLVSGYATPETPLSVTLKRNGGLLAVANTEADWWGYYEVSLYDVNGLPAYIQAGDVVEVKSAQTVAVTVPVMEAVVDVATRMVHGFGPANALVGLYTEFGNKTVKTDANGAFSTVFSTYTPTSNGSGLVIMAYREPQGNVIMAHTGLLENGPAYLAARWHGIQDNSGDFLAHAVSGNAGAPLRQVLLSLRRGDQVVATGAVMSDQYGAFRSLLRDAAAQPVDILAGDVVDMVAGDITKSMAVPLLTAQANLASRTLYGVGPANAALQVSSWNSYCGDNTTIDAGGNWVLACEHLDVGDSGWIQVTDLQGNRTYLDWSTSFVEVRLNGNMVEGTVAPEAPVRVQLQRGQAVIAEAVDTAEASNGWFWIEFLGSGGSPVMIRPDDSVVVTSGDRTITVPVVPLSAVIDIAADKVSGVGPAGQELTVSAAPIYMYREERDVMVGADGSYTADFAGATDVNGGTSIYVWHCNADGNIVYLEQNAPLIRINLGSDIVDGYATPNAMASLVLKRGGSVLASAQALTGMAGAFSAFFLDGAGNLVDLVAGDVVEVTASPTVASAAMGLTAVLDPGNDTVSGMGPAGAALLVVAYRCEYGRCDEHRMTVIADGSGYYTASFTGMFDLDLSSYAYVQATDAQGNMTSAATVPSEVPQRTWVENDLQEAGATLLKGAFGTANYGNLAPPMIVTVLGTGKLFFVARGGILVVTAPDGVIMQSDSGYLTVANPLSGKWQVQVIAAGYYHPSDDDDQYGEGYQYAVAAGQGLYTIYMPIVKQKK